MADTVYMVRCADGSFYTGWSSHLEQRIQTHNRGKGAAYTRSRLPVTLVYFEIVDGRSQALRREAAIKKLSHAEKKKMAETFTVPAHLP